MRVQRDRRPDRARRPRAARVGRRGRSACARSRRTSGRSDGGCIAIIAIGGLRFLLRALAWRLCLEPPHTLALADAFAAVICGDAIGNLTPLGPLVGEPAKAAFVRSRVALAPAVTALAIENVLYTLSAAAMIAAGMIALLFTLPAPDRRPRRRRGRRSRRRFVLFVVALWLLWRQPALISRALGSPRGCRRTPTGVRADRRADLHLCLAAPARRCPPWPRRRSDSTCSASRRST